MTKKQLPYKVVSKPPNGYKLPDFFWDMMIKAGVEEVRNINLREGFPDLIVKPF